MPSARNNPDLGKVGVFHAFRWWSPTALKEAGAELFAPRSLPRLVETLIDEGPPSNPVNLTD